MATILPPPEIQFIDSNGNPLAGGKVYTYIPGTTSGKTTFQDSGATIQNTNPITLDAAGRAIIYGAGSYRFIVKDSALNTIYDQLTADTAVGGLAWGGTSTGTANAQVVAASSFSQQDGQQLAFLVGAGLTNTGGATVAPGGGSGVAVLKDVLGGPTALTGGELIAGNAVLLIYDQVRGAFHLVDNPEVSFGGPVSTIASATTTNIGAAFSNNVNITGTTTITSLGSSASIANPLFQIQFASVLTLTYNATSLILPGNASLITAAGDSAVALYLGSGNWQVLSYSRAAVAPNTGAGYAGGFRNLKVTATAATTATVTADGLTLFDSNGNPAYVSAVSLTNTNSGTGANGIDTGVVTVSTWYNVYVIFNPTTQTKASLISLSATAPTLPAGYTFMLRVGALRSAASGGYWRTIQYGRRVQVPAGVNPAASAVIASGTVGTYSVTSPVLVAQSLANFTPPTACAVNITAAPSNFASPISVNMIVAPSSAYSGTNNGAQGSNNLIPPIFIPFAGVAGVAMSAWITLEGASIYYASSGAGGTVILQGWEDNL